MVYGRDRWRNFGSGRLDSILLSSARGLSPGSGNDVVISPVWFARPFKLSSIVEGNQRKVKSLLKNNLNAIFLQGNQLKAMSLQGKQLRSRSLKGDKLKAKIVSYAPYYLC